MTTSFFVVLFDEQQVLKVNKISGIIIVLFAEALMTMYNQTIVGKLKDRYQRRALLAHFVMLLHDPEERLQDMKTF